MARPLSTLVLRDLMLKTLGYEGNDISPHGITFKMYGYAGTQSDLFRLVEGYAIKIGLISKVCEIRDSAWGVNGLMLYEAYTTNFDAVEIQRLSEAFWLLQSQFIIAPGMYGNGASLPYFHVTDHGHQCIQAQEVLPYDMNGYLSKIRAIVNIDPWVIHYMTESVRSFNADCPQAATIMIGLTAEKLVLNLIDSFKGYLNRNKATLRNKPSLTYVGDVDIAFITEANSNWQISIKYSVFVKYFEGMKLPATLTSILDTHARNSFSSYIRLLRNEVSHPNDLVKDYTETLLLFVSFLKYIDKQTSLINILDLS